MWNVAIRKLHKGESLAFDEMVELMNTIMSGSLTDAEIAECLTLLARKGESVDELAGAAAALQQRMTTITCSRDYLIDTCGTGGSGKHTFNISTAAAFVAVAAGATVAKHGNRAITGSSGSADVLQELGVRVDAPFAVIEDCLNEIGICFCFAPQFHPSVKHAAAARKQLNFPTIFNLLGPLCNPARAPYQLLGAGRGETRRLLAEALARLGTQRSAVLHGRDGIGEVSISAETDVDCVTGTGIEVGVWSPEDFGVTRADLGTIQVSSPQQSANLIRQVLDNREGPCLEIVVANAAAALWLVGIAESFQQASKLARQALASGMAKHVLNQLVERTNSC
ncbi:MAG TPA: anthranilate phosphoribosyltransferase [Pirellulaceae bacterium]|nr:anthranilate phosphoribosyltransferase [Pirellulaceae bacterium]HMO93041.1 anthranilate phosphoribosyltransferase [Pirellulaceae bacterium]HMP69671.1 anthranilate phosphoribosyltransferase [Pirellulaceae bacterium]